MENNKTGKQLLATCEDGKITFWNVIPDQAKETYQKAGNLSPIPSATGLFGLAKSEN